MTILDMIRQEVQRYLFRKEMDKITIYCSKDVLLAVCEDIISMGFYIPTEIDGKTMTKEEFVQQMRTNPMKQIQMPGIPLLVFKDVLSSGYQIGEMSGYRKYLPAQDQLKNNQLYETNKKDL